MINRYLAPHLESASRLLRPGVESLTENDHDHLADILDKVHQDAIVTGSEWDELTSFVARQPHIGLLRRGSWPRMAERLLSELIIADGTAWTQRYESFSRLLAHPTGQRAAVAACADLAADPSNQVFIDTLSILDASPHPDAGYQLVRQLKHPTNDQAFYGALLGCVRKSQYGHFSPEDRHQLLSLTADLSRNLPRSARRRRLAEQIHGALLTEASGTVRILRADEVFERHRLADPHTAEVITGRLLVCIRSAMTAEHDDFHDDLLPVLLDELLFGPLSDIRLFLAMLLAASPYRRGIAGALAAELRRSTATADANVAIALITALAVIGDKTEADVLRTLIIRQDVPAKVRSTAARYIGHMTAGDPSDACRDAAAFHLHRWRSRQDAQSADLLADLTYALGITGDNAQLDVLAQRDIPASARIAAAWWRNMPTAVRSSAQR
ncbi:hypothetical protein [Fodinicola acaciae]|uniref:hypothetical protein n=1 Tax=Fodinicola acaciae TaxID=2681555 RepID=UPI0013D3990D|nr:hypothetical protein [Fodinicola acaciae]